MNDESPSLNSREECGPAGGATNLLHSAVMKHVFSYVFTKIIFIQVDRHIVGNDSLVRYEYPIRQHLGATRFNITSVMNGCWGHMSRNVNTYLSAE